MLVSESRKVIFDVDALRRAAGAKVFARGSDYFDDGLVEIFSLGKERVRARVIGSEPYTVDLAYDGDKFEGHCTCPAWRDFGFCKHMVASALAANHLVAGGGAPEGDGLQDIRIFLDSLDRRQLTQLLLDAAETDTTLLRKLSLIAAAAGLADEDDETLRRKFMHEIMAATRVTGFIAYDEAGDWAAEVEPVVEGLQALVDRGRGAVVIELADLLRTRLIAALNEMDDAGCVDALVDRSVAIFHAACRNAKPDPIKLAALLFKREVDGDAGFDDVIAIYADVLGADGQGEIGRLAAEAWARLKPVKGNRDDRNDGVRLIPGRLFNMLDRQAELAGDIAARIRLRQEILGSQPSYLDLAEFCEKHGRVKVALDWVEEALFLFESDGDERLFRGLAGILERNGATARASEILWLQFAKKPSRGLYQEIVAPLSGEERAQAVDRALEILRKTIASPGVFDVPGFILSILIEQKRFDEAWALIATLPHEPREIEALARECEGSHPDKVLAVFRGSVERMIQAGGNGNYEDAKKRLSRMRTVAKKCGDEKQHAEFENRLLTVYRAKRNFIKLMASATNADSRRR